MIFDNSSYFLDDNVWRVLDSLQNHFDVKEEFCLKGTDYKLGDKISAIDLVKISENLSVDASDLFEGKIDVARVARRVLEEQNMDNDYIPPTHLLDGAFSSTTSLNSLLEEAQKIGRKDYILKKLHIDPKYLDKHRP